MSELKRCPHCGGEAQLIKFRDGAEIISDVVQCQECGSMGTLSPAGLNLPERAISSWNLRTPDSLSPPQALSLEELRERAGKPYYHKSLQGNEDGWRILADFVALNPQDYHYGEWWLAYDREPKEDA